MAPPPKESEKDTVDNIDTSTTYDSITGQQISVESSYAELDEHQTYLKRIYLDDTGAGEDNEEGFAIEAVTGEKSKMALRKSAGLSVMTVESSKKLHISASKVSTMTTRTGRGDSLDFFLEAEVEEVSLESSLNSEEIVTQKLDRTPYLRKFAEAMLDYGKVKRLNNFLHKKMAEYFRKRKMEHVLKETERGEDAAIKYGKKLDNFAVLTVYDEKQRAGINVELEALEELKSKQCTTAIEKFEALLVREQEVGTGLISSKTGKEIPEKYLEKLLSNQRNKAQELQQLRLVHIKIRNALADKSAKIRALDKIGENYTLMEYEQLKLENQGHVDKIEEREDELSILRKKSQSAIQCLAHVREKCAELETNIQEMRNVLLQREMESMRAREQMNKLKQQRDWFRHETQRLREENGLLTKDKLLIDMEDAMGAIGKLQELTVIKIEMLNEQREKLKNIKFKYECEMRRRRSVVTNAPKTKTLQLGVVKTETKVYQVRPSSKIFRPRRPTVFVPQYEPRHSLSKCHEITKNITL